MPFNLLKKMFNVMMSNTGYSFSTFFHSKKQTFFSSFTTFSKETKPDDTKHHYFHEISVQYNTSKMAVGRALLK